jgi:hypothetical protein
MITYGTSRAAHSVALLFAATYHRLSLPVAVQLLPLQLNVVKGQKRVVTEKKPGRGCSEGKRGGEQLLS